MTYTILSAAEAALKEHPFPFAFLTLNNELIGSDSRTGICEGLIEDYENLSADESDPDPWATARFGLLATASGAAQATLIDVAYAQFPGLQESLSEDELTALLHPKDEDVLEFEAWPRDELPLILMAEGYAPYTDVTAPKGDGIVWVTSYDERQFLDSLERLGFGKLWVHTKALESLDAEF